MFGFIICISLALLIASNFVRTHPLESGETRGHHKIDLNTLKNAAEVVRVLKALNEDGTEPESLQREEGYGKQEELQGIDMDYLGLNEARYQDVREILDLIQRNKDAQENHDRTKSELATRVYYISNPEVLEKYRKKIKKETERDSSASNDPDDNREKRIKDVWELIKTMRREGDVEDKAPSVKMMHPRLLHLNLENQVPSFGTNIGVDEKELRKIKDVKNDKYKKLTSALDNLETTKMPLSFLEVNIKYPEKESLRTTGYKSDERDEGTNDKGNKKKDSSDSTSEDDDKRVTIIDFKAKEASKEMEFEDQSLESYKPPKKEKREKKESIFDDDNDDFLKKNRETYKSPSKKKETAIDDNYSLANNKKKRNRWEKQEDKKDKWEKRDDKYEEKIKYKPPKREPRKEERNYEMNRPRIRPESSRPSRYKKSKLRNDDMGNNNFRQYGGRTPIPIVGKKGIYEDD